MQSTDQSWLDRLQRRASATGPVVVASTYNLGLILENDTALSDRFRFNDFTCVIELRAPRVWRPGKLTEDEDVSTYRDLNDTDYAVIKRYISAVYEFDASNADIAAQIRAVAERFAYNPVQDYLRSVTWDGTERLSGWLVDYLGVENTNYARTVARKWLIGATARALRPGCKMDTMLVLEGTQGLKKSSALETLAGSKFFSDTELEIGTRESRQQIQGVWILEFSELDALRRAEVTRTKAFLSQREDKFRFNYDRLDRRIPRRCVFAGSTNKDDYLHDETGGRRFWPVLCRNINLEGLAAVRDQLWAEAVRAFDAGENWWIAADDQEFANEVALRTETEVWEGTVVNWLGALGESVVTREELLLHCLEVERKQWDARVSQRLGRVMKSLRWVRMQARVDANRRAWYYVQPGVEPPKEVFARAEMRRTLALNMTKVEAFERESQLRMKGLSGRALPLVPSA